MFAAKEEYEDNWIIITTPGSPGGSERAYLLHVHPHADDPKREEWFLPNNHEKCRICDAPAPKALIYRVKTWTIKDI